MYWQLAGKSDEVTTIARAVMAGRKEKKSGVSSDRLRTPLGQPDTVVGLGYMVLPPSSTIDADSNSLADAAHVRWAQGHKI